jgi:hypothetical protein
MTAKEGYPKDRADLSKYGFGTGTAAPAEMVEMLAGFFERFTAVCTVVGPLPHRCILFTEKSFCANSSVPTMLWFNCTANCCTNGVLRSSLYPLPMP